MATIEELLNLTDEGWKDIAKFNDEELSSYLKDIKSLEDKVKQSTIYKNKDEDKSDGEPVDSSNNDNLDSGDGEDALSALKKSTEDEDSPFDKRNKKKYKQKKQRKVLSTYDIDLEAEKLKEELGL